MSFHVFLPLPESQHRTAHFYRLPHVQHVLYHRLVAVLRLDAHSFQDYVFLLRRDNHQTAGRDQLILVYPIDELHDEISRPVLLEVAEYPHDMLVSDKLRLSFRLLKEASLPVCKALATHSRKSGYRGRVGSCRQGVWEELLYRHDFPRLVIRGFIGDAEPALSQHLLNIRK